jgi:hypothetical protein
MIKVLMGQLSGKTVRWPFPENGYTRRVTSRALFFHEQLMDEMQSGRSTNLQESDWKTLLKKSRGASKPFERVRTDQ